MTDDIHRSLQVESPTLVQSAGLPARHPIRRALAFALNYLTVTRPVYTFEDTGAETRLVRRPAWPKVTFLAVVIIPSLIAQMYLALFAADQYMAEARFAVRTAEIEAPAEKLNTLLSSIGSMPTFSSSSQYAYVVSNYIRSRAMIEDIAGTVDLRQIYRRPEADSWARLGKNASVEQLNDYWQNMVSSYVDAPSGIVKLQVLAFRKEDAVQIASAVLILSEKLINNLSARARADAMQLAEQEVRRTDGLVRTALADMRKYRDQEGLIDPMKSADETGKLLMNLVSEKIRLESELFVARSSMSDDSPIVRNLRTRIASIEPQIDELRSKLTGNSTQAKNVAGALSRFEELDLQRKFAEKLYSMAQDGMARARMIAERQAVYLTVFVNPAAPEDASFPRRLAYSLVIPFMLSVCWGIGALILASIEDHRI